MTASRFYCPTCHAVLEPGAAAYVCVGCRSEFPLLHGFADFRIGAATDFDHDEDRRFADLLAARERDYNFAELRAYYYSLNPEASPELHQLHEAHFHSEAIRAARTVAELATGPLLDLGCGAGQYLLAAARLGIAASGVDASICQLILARRLLADDGISLELALADVESLPFRNDSFSAVIAADIIEHISEPEKLLCEAARVMTAVSTLRLTTPNRFSLTPEPHVGLWGVGWLPCGVAVHYVRARTNIDYRSIRMLSLSALRKRLNRTFPRVEIRLPLLTAAELNAFSPLKRTFAHVYGLLSQLAPVRPLMLRVTPYFEATCRK